MIRINTWKKSFTTIILFACSHLGDAQVSVGQPLETEAESDDVEVLTRGPVHEAFAAQIGEEPRPGLEVPRQPPEPINEIPPEVKPEGDDVIWINGYWQWDEERADFVWVSGVWRRIPVGQRWVPGYWDEVDGRYRWISGFWVGAKVEELSYQPYPPESLESGPSSLAPTDEHVWVPGCWIYQSDNYAWRPGYWWEPIIDSVYIPAHYAWTPNGCIYVAGYYDHPLDRRGVLFSPVYFPHRAYTRVGYHYSPYVSINTTGLLLHLFFRPSVGNYCFGDYYGSHQRNYYPWFDYHLGGRHYDPFHAHFKATHRHTGIDYTSRARGWHKYFADHSDRRPPHTLAAQHRYESQHRSDSHLRQSLLAQNVEDLAGKERGRDRFVRIGNDVRDEVARRAHGTRDIGSQRSKFESRSQNRLSATSRPTNFSLPKDAGRARGIVGSTTDRPSNSPFGRAATDHDRPDRGPRNESQRSTSRRDPDSSVSSGRSENTQRANDIRARVDALRRNALGDRQSGNATRPSPSTTSPSGNVVRNPSPNANRSSSPANAPTRPMTTDGRDRASANLNRSSTRSNRVQAEPTRSVPQASPSPAGRPSRSTSTTTPRSLPSFLERALNSSGRTSGRPAPSNNRATSPRSIPSTTPAPSRTSSTTPSVRPTRPQPAVRSPRPGTPSRHSPSAGRSRSSSSARAVPPTRAQSAPRRSVSPPSSSRSTPSRSFTPPSSSSRSTPSFRSGSSRTPGSSSRGRGGSSRSRRDRN